MNRYDRQMRCHSFGSQAQAYINQASIMVIGAGALGSAVSEQLTRIGTGHLIIFDMDIVEISNLHRQSCYTEDDIKDLKVDALQKHLTAINSSITIDVHPEEITNNNILDYIQSYQPDLIIDGTDQFLTRYIINEACHKLKIPWIYGACLGSKGTVCGIDHTSACLSCFLPVAASSGQDCTIEGILPPAVHIAANLQVAEAMRFFKDQQFSGQLISFDLSAMSFNSIETKKFKRAECPVCSQQKYTHLLKPQSKITKLCGGQFLIRLDPSIFHYTSAVFQKSTPYFKYFQHETITISLFHDGRAIVNGAQSKEDVQQIVKQHILK